MLETPATETIQAPSDTTESASASRRAARRRALLTSLHQICGVLETIEARIVALAQPKPKIAADVESGERHHLAKLDPLKIREIRRRRQAGELLVALAEEFGVTTQTIWAIVTGKTWRHIDKSASGLQLVRRSGRRSAHTINQRRTDMGTMAGRTGKIYTMNLTTLDEDDREMRRVQIKQNEKHAARAREIVRVFNPEETEQETNLSDMLANLMHLCDAEGWNFDAQIEQGRFHYKAESGDDPSKWIV